MPKLTNEERQQFTQAFKIIDVNQDGQISQSELKVIMKQFGFDANDDLVKLMIKKIDLDGNGSIQLQQFLNFIQNSQGSKGDQRQQLLKTFKLFDKDGNGLINQQQLLEGLNKLGQKMTLNDIESLMSEADTDGDGFINFQEFLQLMGQK